MRKISYTKELIDSESFQIEIKNTYNNISQLYIDNCKLFRILKDNDILFKIFPEDYHTTDYWNYDTCKEVSKSFKSSTHFYMCFPEAFEMSMIYGWLNEYKWIKNKSLSRPFWTFERIKKLIEIKQYKSREEFKEDEGGAYSVAWKNKWLNDLIDRQYGRLYWTYERCYEIAQKCLCFAEMNEIARGAAEAAGKKGWVKDYTWFKTHKDALKEGNIKFCVYLYTDGIAAYIGLTRSYRIKTRHHEHQIVRTGEKTDSVKEYFDSKNEKIPEPIILKNNLTVEEAQYYEDYYKNKYKENGYIIINRAKTGIGSGAVGGGLSYYTKERCAEISKKYNTLNEFYLAETNVYDIAIRRDWIKDFTWLKRQREYKGRHFWTYEEVKAEAEKYDYLWDFGKNSTNAYSAAIWHNWIEDFTWLKRQKKKPTDYKTLILTKEHCFKIAKQYKSINEFYHSDYLYYKFARNNDYLNDYIWIKSIYLKWSKERCEQEARKYTSLSDFELNCYGGYHVSVKEGWITEFDWLK